MSRCLMQTSGFFSAQLWAWEEEQCYGQILHANLSSTTQSMSVTADLYFLGSSGLKPEMEMNWTCTFENSKVHTLPCILLHEFCGLEGLLDLRL